MAGVKWFSSNDMSGAPVLTGAVGALIGVLDACLVNGFGAKSVSSLVIAGGVATVTVSGGHSFVPLCVVRIAGATVSGGTINGEHRVSATGLNTISFPTALANQTATGTIVIDMAPAGWAKLAGTNKAAYHSVAAGASGFWVRVDDTPGSVSSVYAANVRGYELMSDVDTGVNPFPSVAQATDGVYWKKQINTVSNVASWSVFADESFAIVCVGSDANYHEVVGFGDVLPARPGDTYACAVIGLNGRTTSPNAQHGSMALSGIGGDGGYFARAYTGFAGGHPFRNVADADMAAGTDRVSGNSGGTRPASPYINYPNAANNGLLLSAVSLIEASSNTMRGKVPGAAWVPMRMASAVPNGANIDGSGTYAGRKLRAVRTGNGSTSEVGCMYFDITGPWR